MQLTKQLMQQFTEQFTQRGSYLVSVFTLLLTLSACGGGGSDASIPTAPTSPTTPTTPTTPVTPSEPDLETAFGGYLGDLADKVILPGYAGMASSAATLKEQADDFCDLNNPVNSDLNALQDDWKALNQSWQAIQWVKVGPVVTDNRLFRIAFFPDSNDAVSRGVDSLLIESQTVTAEIVAGQNVGGQGIPALEYLLYPASASDSLLSASDARKRCEVVSAIAQNLVNITRDISDEWSVTGANYRQQLVSGTGDFTSVQDSVEELVTNWLEAVELVKDEKMLIPLGTEAPGFPAMAEHVLSDESLNSIASNLQAFVTLYNAGNGQGFDDILTAVLEQNAINTEMSDALNQTMSAFNTLHQNFQAYPELLNTPQGRQQLQSLIDEVRDVRDILSASFVQALDINIGFNANDGD